MNQSIRIIGGSYRGKKLHVPHIEGLRPTPDRIRETLFNWLMHDIRQARCLDAFAGSGALGFEAFSRGASKVTLIENSEEAFLNLKSVRDSFQTTNVFVLKTDASDYIKQQATLNKEQFDIIFFDPPFAKPHLLDSIIYLEHSNVLIPNGLLYLETPNEIALNPLNWEKLKIKQAGQVVYALYRKYE